MRLKECIPSSPCSFGGELNYAYVPLAGVPGAATYVIDPCFREQFEIANPTAQYSAVLAEVPREFVGTEERVTQLVELLSAELKKSFQVSHWLCVCWRNLGRGGWLIDNQAQATGGLVVC